MKQIERDPLFYGHLAVWYFAQGEVMRRVREQVVTVCGAGALGANIVESLARAGFGRLRVIGRDRVEERNLSTQPFYRSDIGAQKVRILANSLYRAVGVRVEARAEELTDRNARKLLDGLVVDAFDNSASRAVVKAACEEAKLACLHVGLAGAYAEVISNDSYRLPSAAQDDICDYPLARNLVMLAASIACEAVIRYVAQRTQESFTITLEDFAVRRFEV